jgi:hypothetical protein
VELEAQIGRMKRTMLSSKILRRRFEMSSFLKINLSVDPGGGGGAGGSERADEEDNAEFENFAKTLVNVVVSLR